MSTTLKIIGVDEELKMFYLPLTIETHEKISIIVPVDVYVGVGEMVEFNMSLVLECDTHQIILQPNQVLQDSPLNIHNLSNPYNRKSKIKLFNNPIRDTYKKFIDSGIDAFKTDLLKRVIGKSSKGKIIDKILNNVPAYKLEKGNKILDVYLHDYSRFKIEIV